MELKELKELKAKALELKAENVCLNEKVNTKQNEYAQIIEKNFVEIILPYMREMNDFIKSLGCIGLDIRKPLLDKNNISAELRLTSHGIRILYKEWESYGLDCSIAYEDHYKKLKNYNWISLADFFDSVDSCDAFIKTLNESYAVILSKVIKKFETENPSLAETLRDLTEKVSKASCMEEKENGTVEIHLGGKTYTAVLKEE